MTEGQSKAGIYVTLQLWQPQQCTAQISLHSGETCCKECGEPAASTCSAFCTCATSLAQAQAVLCLVLPPVTEPGGISGAEPSLLYIGLL